MPSRRIVHRVKLRAQLVLQLIARTDWGMLCPLKNPRHVLSTANQHGSDKRRERILISYIPLCPTALRCGREIRDGYRQSSSLGKIGSSDPNGKFSIGM